MRFWKKAFALLLAWTLAFHCMGCGESERFFGQEQSLRVSEEEEMGNDAGQGEASDTDGFAFVGKDVYDQMFEETSLDNTWLFGGGVETQGRFAEIGGVRNYMGQFEEYIRWERRIDSTLYGMQRFTVNAGKAGRDAAGFADELERYISIVHPKAIAYLIGPEDYRQGEKGLEKFKKAVETIIQTSLSMRNNRGCAVIQMPHAVKEERDASNAKLYASAVEEVVLSIKADRGSDRIAVVNHLSRTDTRRFKNEMLTEDGLLNADGHYEIARQLAETVCKSAEGFPEISDVWKEEEPSELPPHELPENSFRKQLRHAVSSREKPLTWLFMGDSITHAAGYTYGYDGMTQIFEKYLKEDLGREDDVVINTGVVGATTLRTLEHMDERMTIYRPDIVSVMLGTNDSRELDTDDFKTGLKQIVEKIKETNSAALIVLRSPTPARDWEGAALYPGSDGYIAAMKSIADEDENILFVDQYTKWNQECEANPQYFDRQYYFGDGSVHPGAAGQLRMARQFIQECGLNANTRIAKLSYQLPSAK